MSYSVAGISPDDVVKTPDGNIRVTITGKLNGGLIFWISAGSNSRTTASTCQFEGTAFFVASMALGPVSPTAMERGIAPLSGGFKSGILARTRNGVIIGVVAFLP